MTVLENTGKPLLSFDIASERDVALARRRARVIAETVGFDVQEQTRIATACSEIVRNAFRYAKKGRVEFSLSSGEPQALLILVSDDGPGIPHLNEVLAGRYKSETGMGLGIVGAMRLMDGFNIEPAARGTRVVMEKRLRRRGAPLHEESLRKSIEAALRKHTGDLAEEVELQNRELMLALEQLQVRQLELERLNRELDDTNRGVVALYAELDERAALLQRTSELKSRFLSNMSHEFRTPLNSIISLSNLLQDRVDGDLTPEQAKQVGFIRRSAESLLEMVNDLLDLAKIEAGKLSVRMEEFSVDELFGALRGMLRPLTSNTHVLLTFEKADQLPRLKTDQSKLSQILRNFISNALKFTPEGEVIVRAESGPHDTIVFRVTDTGVGIAKADQERIFEEFTQIDNELQRKSKGTGLGLPLTRKLAELLGGEVRVESEPGKGSTFTTILPRVIREADTARPMRSLGIAIGGRVKALVVDDDEIARYVLRGLLGTTGFEIAEANNGQEAVEIARRQPPDIIFLDLIMPVMGGEEALAALKSDEKTRDIPVVIHTSRVLDPDERERLLQHAVDVIPKASGSRESSLKLLSLALHRAGLQREPAPPG